MSPGRFTDAAVIAALQNARNQGFSPFQTAQVVLQAAGESIDEQAVLGLGGPETLSLLDSRLRPDVLRLTVSDQDQPGWTTLLPGHVTDQSGLVDSNKVVDMLARRGVNVDEISLIVFNPLGAHQPRSDNGITTLQIWQFLALINRQYLMHAEPSTPEEVKQLLEAARIFIVSA